MGDVLKTGYLNYSQKKVLKSQWSKKFFALTVVIKDKPGIHLYGFQDEKTYAKYERECCPLDAAQKEKKAKNSTQLQINQIKSMTKVLLKGQDALEVTTDGGKKFTFLAEQQGYNCAESWLDTYKFAEAQIQPMRGHDTGSLASDSWSLSMSVGDAENEIYESTDEGVSFPVVIQETEISNHLSLSGTYDLQINTRNLTLVDQKTQKGLYVWPYKYLRRYGRNAKEFSFECGRRASSGQGYFKFFTLQGNDIFWKVESMAKMIRECERQSSVQSQYPPSTAPQNSVPSQYLPSTAPQNSNILRTTSIRNQNHKDAKEKRPELDQDTAVYAEPVKKPSRQSQTTPPVPRETVYHYAEPTGPSNDNCMYSVENKPPGISQTCNSRPPIPPRPVTTEFQVGAYSNTINNTSAAEYADYADPDALESEYAYASAEDVKRDHPWMKEDANKFRIEQGSFSDDNYTS